MRKLHVQSLAAALISGLVIGTQAASVAVQSEAAALTDTGQSPPQTSTTLRVSGTIDKYDASTRMLSVATSTGIVQFPIASTARISQRRDKLEITTLQKLAGYRVAIRYSESSGNKIVESVQVFSKDERTTR